MVERCVACSSPLLQDKRDNSPSLQGQSSEIMMAENLDDPFADETAPAPPPKKKSLFTKSLWNKPVKPVEQKEGIDFFSRAEEMWPERLAEEKRKREKKLVKLERKRSTVSAERKPSSTPDNKRRRVSREDPKRRFSNGSVNHDDADEASWTRR